LAGLQDSLTPGRIGFRQPTPGGGYRGLDGCAAGAGQASRSLWRRLGQNKLSALEPVESIRRYERKHPTVCGQRWPTSLLDLDANAGFLLSYFTPTGLGGRGEWGRNRNALVQHKAALLASYQASPGEQSHGRQ
jgi:hypothetical protein